MAITIKDLQPREVWKHFEALTQVPRPSGHLEKIQKYLLDFGKSINVETWQDEAGNIIMRKPATPGLDPAVFDPGSEKAGHHPGHHHQRHHHAGAAPAVSGGI